MFVKIKDMQRFIREKIDFDKKSCLENIKGASFGNVCKKHPK